jgi:translocation and assembly module TamA
VPSREPRLRTPQAAEFPVTAPAFIALVLLCCGLPWQDCEARVRVQIDGVEAELEANIRATLDLVRHGSREDLSEAAIRRLHSRARGQIREAMRPFGYYRPEIEATLERQEAGWLARFRIDPREPVLVSEIDLRLSGEGADEPRLLAVLADSPLAVGRRLRHDEHDRLRNALQSEAAILGYFEARFDQRRLEVDPAEHTARVVLHLDTGPRYQLGEVQVAQDILNASLLRRLILIEAGQAYDANKLLQAQYRLSDSGYFATVLVETGAPDPETRTVPVNIETTPTRRQRIRMGVGYATDTRVRGSLGLDWRRLNAAGHSAGVELRLSEPLSELAGRYRIPIGDPLKEHLLFRGAMTQQELGDLESRRSTLGLSHVTLRGGGWQRTLFTDILDERTRLPEEPDFTDTLIIPGIGMEKLIADNVLFPMRGYRLRGEMRGSHAMLGARSDFLRFEFEANHVSSIGERWRFFARSQLGLGIVESLDVLPASQRFFAGGDQSVRGFGFNSLGPQDEAGNTIGGRHLLFGSLEAERQVWGRVALAAFVDAGNAVDSFSDGLEASVGTGINVRTPIGTLRIAVARAVTQSRGLRFHLTIRPDL